MQECQRVDPGRMPCQSTWSLEAPPLRSRSLETFLSLDGQEQRRSPMFSKRCQLSHNMPQFHMRQSNVMPTNANRSIQHLTIVIRPFSVLRVARAHFSWLPTVEVPTTGLMIRKALVFPSDYQRFVRFSSRTSHQAKGGLAPLPI